MKLIIFAIASLVYSASAGFPERPPMCNNEEKVRKIYVRNINDPTKYWGCFDYNKPADELFCPIGQGFDENQLKCVDWNLWKWTEPLDQPSGYRQALSYTEGHDGRPACTTDYELKQIYWRNNNDPTKYWKCEVPNHPAIEMKCPDGYAFIAPVEVCIPLDRWEWTPPMDPPSLA